MLPGLGFIRFDDSSRIDVTLGILHVGRWCEEREMEYKYGLCKKILTIDATRKGKIKSKSKGGCNVQKANLPELR
jgi:hypothetical protein